MADDSQLLRDVDDAEEQAFFPEEHKMMVGEKEITIRPLVLAQFKKMVNVVAHFVGVLAAQQPDLDLENLGGSAQLLVTTASGQITPLLAALSGLDEEYIENNMTIPQVAKFLRLVLEVNELPQVVSDFCAAARLTSKQLDWPRIRERAKSGVVSGAAPLTS